MNQKAIKMLLNRAKENYPTSITINGTNYIVIKISTDVEADFEDIADDDVLFTVGEIVDDGNGEYYLSVSEITLETLLQADEIVLFKEVATHNVKKCNK